MSDSGEFQDDRSEVNMVKFAAGKQDFFLGFSYFVCVRFVLGIPWIFSHGLEFDVFQRYCRYLLNIVYQQKKIMIKSAKHSSSDSL